MSISKEEYQQLLENQKKSKKPRKNKYNATTTYCDGYRFDSTKEMKYYQTLKLRKQAGEIKYFLRQVPFHLAPKVTYRCDFAVIDPLEHISYWEVKGLMTDTARVKIAMTEELYDVKINIA